MSRKVFITYGNEIYYESLKRISVQAESTGEFDKIIVYTDADLPEYIRQHPLMQYKRGGGYWLWKPYFILKTLQEEAREGDIVVYSDAGSEVFRHHSWAKYFEMMKTHGVLCFKIAALMKVWTRKNLLQFYEHSCHNIGDMYQIMSGISFWTRKGLPIAQEWYEIMAQHPEFVIDATDEERAHEIPEFKENRHDQSVLTCVVYKYLQSCNAKVIWNRFHYLFPDGNAVFTARIASTPQRQKGTPHVIYSRQKIFFLKVKAFIRDIREVFFKFKPRMLNRR